MTKPAFNNVKRRAWIYQPEPLPSPKALMGSKKQRKAFFDYWLRKAPFDALDILAFLGFSLLPSKLTSRIGAELGQRLMPRLYKTQTKRATETIRRLRPDLSPSNQDALLLANQRAQGSVLTEFSVITRLKKDPSPVHLYGMEKIQKAHAKGPVIIIGMHISNWELGAYLFPNAGMTPHINYVPPKERGKSWISTLIRKKGGVVFLPPGFEGIRPAINALKDGGLVSVFCDEGFEGKIRGPFFDCEPHLNGNLGYVARLARMSGATLCPWYCRRTGDFKFEFYALDPINLPEGPKTPQQIWDDVALLNSVIEPVILANLDQWYFLDNRLGPKKKP